MCILSAVLCKWSLSKTQKRDHELILFAKEVYSKEKNMVSCIEKYEFKKIVPPLSRYNPLSWKVDTCQLEKLLCCVFSHPISSLFRTKFAS